jgi:hypothetical protein
MQHFSAKLSYHSKGIASAKLVCLSVGILQVSIKISREIATPGGG